MLGYHALMAIDVVEEPMAALPDHARIPIVFQVERVLDVTVKPHGGGFVLAERPLVVPFRKDYDAIEGNAPARWAEEFDLSNWGLIAARSDGERLGGAVIAFDTEGVTMLEGRRDLAVLWDIRVSLGHRRKGVGSALFRAAEAWARARRCSQDRKSVV